MRSLRARLWLAAIVALIAAGAIAWTLYDLASHRAPAPGAVSQAPTPAMQVQPPSAAAAGAPGAAPPAVGTAVGCDDPAFAGAAAANAQSLEIAPPGLDWTAYVPVVAREIATACPPGSGGFARALAAWRAAHGLRPAGGVMDAATVSALEGVWALRRPFVRASAHGVCPPSPPESALAAAGPDETYGGKHVELLPGALAAWRRMRAAARAELPAVAADPRLLTLVSGWRGPEEEAARCAQGGCDNRVRATCSAHRTGAALDIFLGDPATDASPASRRAKADSPAYRWLVANADRYGFAPYPFEPWHWEWTGGA